MNKTKTDTKSVNDPGGQRSIFFNNILLLGFQPGAMEAKHSIPFTKDMFAMPNKKAFEVVLHFLLSRLNPALAKERFRVCYPVCDKKQEQLFRRAVSNWLTEITKDDHVVYLPRISPSLLMSPSGEKFYNLLLHLSSHVLLTVARSSHGLKSRDLLQRPRLVPSSIHLGSVMVKTVGACAIRHRKRFLEQVQETTVMQEQWAQYAAELTKEHRSITKSIRGLERKLQELYDEANHLAKTHGSPPPVRRHQSGDYFEGEPEVQAIRRTKKVQKVRDMWKTVNELYNAQKLERDVLQSILDGAANRFKLDASDVNVNVPELLLRDCEKELQRRNLGNTYEGGKLNLLTLIHLWNLSLHLYLEELNQVSMPDFGELSPTVVTQVHDQHTHLANTQALRSNLANELLPQLKESIAMLTEQIEGFSDSTLKQHDSLRSSKNKSDLTLLPSTPPVSFQPDTSVKGATPKELTHKVLRKSPDIMDTPEAATLLRSVIDKEAMKHTSLAQGTPVSTAKHLKDMGSKLPRSTHLEHDVAEDRKRVKSAPSRTHCTSTPLPCQPLGHGKNTPKRTPKVTSGSCANQQMETQAGNYKELMLRRKELAKTDIKKKLKPKQRHRNHQKPITAVKTKPITNGNGTPGGRDLGKPPITKNKTTVSNYRTPAVFKVSRPQGSDIATPVFSGIGTPDVDGDRPPVGGSIGRSTVGSGRKQRVAKPESAVKASTLAAHMLLADQIADAVAGSSSDGSTVSPTTQPLSLYDPIAALHQTAFTTRDKLSRTPENIEKRDKELTVSPMPTKKLFDEEWLESPNGYHSTSEEKISVVTESHKQDVEKEMLLGRKSSVSDANENQETVARLFESNRNTRVKHENGSNLDDVKDHVLFNDLNLDLQASDSPILDGSPHGLYKNFQSDLSEIFSSKTPILPLRSRQRLEARKDSSVESPITEVKHISDSIRTLDEIEMPLPIDISEIHGVEVPLSPLADFEMPLVGLSCSNSDLSAEFIENKQLQRKLSEGSEHSQERVPKSTLKNRTRSGDSQKSVHFSGDLQQNIFDKEANASEMYRKPAELDEDLSSVQSHGKKLNLSGIFSDDESFDLDTYTPVEELLHYVSPAITPAHVQRHGEPRLLGHKTNSPFDISKHDATVSLLQKLNLVDSDIEGHQQEIKPSEKSRQESPVALSLFPTAPVDELSDLIDTTSEVPEWNINNVDFDLLDEGDDSILMMSSSMTGNDHSINQVNSPMASSDHSSIIQMTSPMVGQLIDI